MILATLCYLKRNGHTLMMLRNRKPADVHEGKWNGLGGKMLPGESPEDCVVREVHEESGYLIEQPELRGVMTFPEFTPGEDWYVFLFTCDRIHGSQIESNEGQLEWISDNRLNDLNLWPGDRYFLRWLEEKRFFSAKFIYKKGVLESFSHVFYPRGT